MVDKDRIQYRMQRVELADGSIREYSELDNVLTNILGAMNEEGDFVVGELKGKVERVRYSIIEIMEGTLPSVAICPAYFIANKRPIKVEFILPLYTLDNWYTNGEEN